MSSSFLLVGTVSNVEKKLESEIGKIVKAIQRIGDLDIFLVESDSTDKTLTILENLKGENPNFSYKTFGILKPKYPERTERIRFCRNAYVDYIRTYAEERRWDFVIVADLDGMNSAISEKRILNSLKKDNQWDACFANQTLGYYDLYALRAENWVEQDCFYDLHKLQEDNIYKKKYSLPLLDFLSVFLHFDKLRKKAIYKKMRWLKGDLIPVKSAFGGFGIYKSEIFNRFNYVKTNSVGVSECEHLDLHYQCTQNGFRLFIDPGLINNHINIYNLNKFFFIRFLKEFKKFIIRTRTTSKI